MESQLRSRARGRLLSICNLQTNIYIYIYIYIMLVNCLVVLGLSSQNDEASWGCHLNPPALITTGRKWKRWRQRSHLRHGKNGQNHPEKQGQLRTFYNQSASEYWGWLIIGFTAWTCFHQSWLHPPPHPSLCLLNHNCTRTIPNLWWWSPRWHGNGIERD